MFTTPALIPVTEPVEDPTVATEISLLVQVPPPEPVSILDDPEQTLVIPDIAPGNGFTVTVVVVLQPVTGNE